MNFNDSSAKGHKMIPTDVGVWLNGTKLCGLPDWWPLVRQGEELFFTLNERRFTLKVQIVLHDPQNNRICLYCKELT